MKNNWPGSTAGNSNVYQLPMTPAHSVPQVTRDEFIEQAHHNAPGDMSDPEQAFTAGFDAGEGYGYTTGFHKGAEEAARGLIGPADRGMRAREELLQGNMHGGPRMQLDAIQQDQLTAEIVLILSMYASLPGLQRARAVIDALKTIPGVEYEPVTLKG